MSVYTVCLDGNLSILKDSMLPKFIEEQQDSNEYE